MITLKNDNNSNSNKEHFLDDDTELTIKNIDGVPQSEMIISPTSVENGIAVADVRINSAVLGRFNSLVDYTEFKGRKSMCLRAYITDDQYEKLNDLLEEMSGNVHTRQVTKKLMAAAWPIKERVDENMPYPVIVARTYYPRRHKLVDHEGTAISSETAHNSDFGMGSVVNFVARCIATTTNADHGAYPYIRFNLLGVRILKAASEISYDDVDI